MHTAFVAAGARILTTASYQATPRGFADVGISHDEGHKIIADSVGIARCAGNAHARSEAAGAGPAATPPLIAGSVGPYGAALGDGAEYTGDYRLTSADYTAFHRPRIDALTEAGATVRHRNPTTASTRSQRSSTSPMRPVFPPG